MIQPRHEMCPRLPQQPGVHGIAHLGRVGGMWQCDVQLARCTRRGGVHQSAAALLEAVFGVQHDAQRLAQKGEHRAVFPFNARVLASLLPHLRIAQLAQNPVGLFDQRRVDGR
ncbi:hypothetical protein SDC9_103258 [bioreactor metagenome]|uniref:Uncharacterized protein n=1 Tax=bioreactor metagenome TaxID=1076179 RepID=A0A645B3Z8_9ZZZZ